MKDLETTHGNAYRYFRLKSEKSLNTLQAAIATNPKGENLISEVTKLYSLNYSASSEKL
jgi:hypothetical protein